jgi:hypothetical protein
VPAPKFYGGARASHSPLCPEKWAAVWTGPNATVGGLWNRSVAKLAAQKKLIGVYFGDELLGGGLTVSNLTALTKMVKDVWPDGITYCKRSPLSCVVQTRCHQIL